MEKFLFNAFHSEKKVFSTNNGFIDRMNFLKWRQGRKREGLYKRNKYLMKNNLSERHVSTAFKILLKTLVESLSINTNCLGRLQVVLFCSFFEAQDKYILFTFVKYHFQREYLLRMHTKYFWVNRWRLETLILLFTV